MANKVIIRLHQQRPGLDPDLVSWIVISAEGQPSKVARGSLDEVAEVTRGNQVTLIVPGIDVLLTTVAVPTRNRQRMIAAVPYVLEEQLATDVDDLHFALGERLPDNQVVCAVVDRDLMAEWLQKLQQYGIQPDCLAPDTLMLPKNSTSWSLFVEEDIVIVRTGNQAGFVVELDNLKQLLGLVMNEVEDNKPVCLQIACNDLSTKLPDISALEVETQIESVAKSALIEFAIGIDQAESLNLLQGDFSRREQLGKLWRPWRASAFMLLGLIILNGIINTSVYFGLKNQSNALKQEIEQIYKDTFPDAKKIVNPRVQMQRRLAKLRSGVTGEDSGFFYLLTSVGRIIKTDMDVEIRGARFKGKKLDLDLVIGSLQVLDKLKQKLTGEAGLKVDIVSANARGDNVVSRIQVTSK